MKEIGTSISVYALGGLFEVGKNMYCLESEKSIIIIDCGVAFPEADLPGISYVIPDFSKISASRNKIRGLFITHGHEDHIGAVPYLVQQLNIPCIYAPRLAAALIRNKLNDHRIRTEVKIVEYDKDSHFNLDVFNISFFQVTHSIPDAYGLCVDTPEGRIVHTGDFKIDLTPVGQEIELSKIAKIGMEGVDLLLADSTNAEIEGYTPSEKNVISAIQEIFEDAPGRLIVSTFSSNISRIQQVTETAVQFGRKIAIVGRSMENVVNTSRDFGYIHIPDDSIIPVEDVNKYKLNNICILCTGSQGESMAALSRIARDEHKNIKIIPGDTVVFSSSAIPGNGVTIDRVVNLLARKGADVIINSIVNSVHSSGHPSKQELRIMLKLMNPKYFMPIHGEYRMLRLHGEIAESLGIKKENIFIMDNGDTIELSNHKVSKGQHFNVEPVFVDGNDIQGLDVSLMEEREILKNEGFISIILNINKKENKLCFKPKLISKGLLNVNDDAKRQIIEIAESSVKHAFESTLNDNNLKSDISKKISIYMYKGFSSKPIVSVTTLYPEN